MHKRQAKLLPAEPLLDQPQGAGIDLLPNRPAGVAGFMAVASLSNTLLCAVCLAVVDRFAAGSTLEFVGNVGFAGFLCGAGVTAMIALICGIIGFRRSRLPQTGGRSASVWGIGMGIVVLGVMLLLCKVPLFEGVSSLIGN